MSHRALIDISETLVAQLREAADHDGIPIDPDTIELLSPEEVGAEADTRLAVYPLQVDEDGTTGPTTRQVSESTRREPPLAVSVRYLVVAYPAEDTDQADVVDQLRALGLALQTVHDTPVIDPTEDVPLEQDREVSLSIASVSTDERTSVWTRFPDATHRPSAIIDAGPVMIQSANTDEFTRVSERETDLGRRSDDANGSDGAGDASPESDAEANGNGNDR